MRVRALLLVAVATLSGFHVASCQERESQLPELPPQPMVTSTTTALGNISGYNLSRVKMQTWEDTETITYLAERQPYRLSLTEGESPGAVHQAALSRTDIGWSGESVIISGRVAEEPLNLSGMPADLAEPARMIVDFAAELADHVEELSNAIGPQASDAIQKLARGGFAIGYIPFSHVASLNSAIYQGNTVTYVMRFVTADAKLVLLPDRFTLSIDSRKDYELAQLPQMPKPGVAVIRGRYGEKPVAYEVPGSELGNYRDLIVPTAIDSIEELMPFLTSGLLDIPEELIERCKLAQTALKSVGEPKWGRTISEDDALGEVPDTGHVPPATDRELEGDTVIGPLDVGGHLLRVMNGSLVLGYGGLNFIARASEEGSTVVVKDAREQSRAGALQAYMLPGEDYPALELSLLPTHLRERFEKGAEAAQLLLDHLEDWVGIAPGDVADVLRRFVERRFFVRERIGSLYLISTLGAEDEEVSYRITWMFAPSTERVRPMSATLHDNGDFSARLSSGLDYTYTYMLKGSETSVTYEDEPPGEQLSEGELASLTSLLAAVDKGLVVIPERYGKALQHIRDLISDPRLPKAKKVKKSRP